MKIKILSKSGNILLQHKMFYDIMKLSIDIKKVERSKIKWGIKENYFVNMDQ